ncbi:MAG: hypothetical protein Q4D97_00635 [Eubacteriales bacterium]|nr:hypothetical protein [Eubacteriales bacterium]
MSNSLEAALVISVSLLSSLSILLYEVPFLRAVKGEAQQLKVINDYQVGSKDLYEIKSKQHPYRNKAENTPYVSANPQKSIEAIKLAEDLSKLNNRRQSEALQPLDYLPLPPGYTLPELAGAPDYPGLPDLPGIPLLPEASQPLTLPPPSSLRSNSFGRLGRRP